MPMRLDLAIQPVVPSEYLETIITKR